MPDFATSTDPAVQRQLDRLVLLSPGADILGLDRIARLLDRLDNPERMLPPVFHVAGTNGKGSTCAFLRAAIEAAGGTVHVFSSPHLVRFNERIRVAGALIADGALATLLEEVLDRAEGIGASFFEITAAAACLAFSRTRADACIIEVGLGGRLDANNVIPRAAVCGIAALGIDHEAFLGDTLTGIAREKAGIARPDVPLITLAYPPEVAAAVREAAGGAPLLVQDRDWRWEETADGMVYRDVAGDVALSLPALAGGYQRDNFALAVAMLRHQRAIAVPDAAALRTAAMRVRWPARMQRLRTDGPLTGGSDVPCGIWLDGAHNESAAREVARWWPTVAPNGRSALVIGMLANKDAVGVLAHLAPVVDIVVAVPVPGHEHHPPAELASIAAEHGVSAHTATDPTAALALLGADTPDAILIAGSLYLAGRVLSSNDEVPD